MLNRAKQLTTAEQQHMAKYLLRDLKNSSN